MDLCDTIAGAESENVRAEAAQGQMVSMLDAVDRMWKEHLHILTH